MISNLHLFVSLDHTAVGRRTVSGHPSETRNRIRSKKNEDPQTCVNLFWETLPKLRDARREDLSGHGKVFAESNLKKKVFFEERKAQNEDRFLRGRQIVHVIHEFFRVTGTHDFFSGFHRPDERYSVRRRCSTIFIHHGMKFSNQYKKLFKITFSKACVK